MKKIYLFVVLLICSPNFLTAQLPGIKWQKNLGGTYFNGVNNHNVVISGIVKANNGSYLVVGYDVHYNNSDSADAIVWCLDAGGNLVWQKKFGGSRGDYFYSISKSADGNFVCVGTSKSLNGDVVGNSNSRDAWLLKIDRFGNKIWSKCYGVFGVDENAGSSIATKDTGTVFMFNGNLAKVDKSANLLWNTPQSNVGGDVGLMHEDDVNGNIDITYDTKSRKGNYYYIYSAGYKTFNGQNGTLVQADTLSTSAYKKFNKGNDYILIDQQDCSTCGGNANCGNMANQGWDPPYKSYQIKTKTSTYPLFDQNCIYGCGVAYLGPYILPQDYGTENYYPSIVTINDSTIILATDVSRSTVCSPTYDSTIHDFRGYQVAWRNNAIKYIPFNWSSYKSYLRYYQDTKTFVGQSSTYITSSKELNTNYISGLVYNDADGNGVYNIGEKIFKHFNVKSTNDTSQNVYYAQFDDTEKYTIETSETGKYTTLVTNFTKPYYIITPSSHTSLFAAQGATDLKNFAVEPIPNKTDLQLSLYTNWSIPRPGGNVTYYMTLKNQGTTTPTGELRLIKDPKQTLVSATPNYSSVSGDTLIWNYYSYDLDSVSHFSITFHLDTPTVKIGDTLNMYAIATSTTIDETPNDNSSSKQQIVVGSFDPNDKTENHNGIITTNAIANNEALIYTIRFQNTGNDTAFTVVVKDKIDSKLDINSFEMVAASHPYKLTITEGNKLEWKFDKILLVDSNHNEPASHGYLVYRIKPKSALVHNDTIKNSADIYFDYNQPVKTNAVNTVVINTALPVQFKQFTGELTSNKTVSLRWQMANENSIAKYIVERSNDDRNYKSIATVVANNLTKYKAFDEHPITGINYYRLNIVETDGKLNYSNVIAIKLNDKSYITVYPNPAKNQLVITRSIAATENSFDKVDIFDIIGTKITTIQLNSLHQTVDISSWAKGLYILSFSNGEKIKVVKE